MLLLTTFLINNKKKESLYISKTLMIWHHWIFWMKKQVWIPQCLATCTSLTPFIETSCHIIASTGKFETTFSRQTCLRSSADITSFRDYFAKILLTENIIHCLSLLSQSKVFIYLFAVLQVIEARFQAGKFYSWAGIYVVLVLIDWSKSILAQGQGHLATATNRWFYFCGKYINRLVAQPDVDRICQHIESVSLWW